MAPNPRKSTTQLPKALLEKIQENDAESSTNARRRKFQPNRKELRKQGRDEKRQRKAAHFSQTSRLEEHASKGPKKRSSEQAESTEPIRPTKRPKLRDEKQNSAPVAGPSNPALAKKSTQKIHTPLERLVAKSSRQSKPSTSAALSLKVKKPKDTDDQEIAWLEAKLGLKSGNKKHYDGYVGDDLDELLFDLDRTVTPEVAEDLEAAEDESSEEEEMNHVSQIDSAEEIDEEEDGDEEEDDDPESDSVDDEAPQLVESAETASQPEPSSSSAKYVPPHLRQPSHTQNTPKADPKQTEASEKLIRQMKGLLNRLSEQNIESILGEVEGIYRNHPRNDVTTILTSIILESITSHSSLLDAFVVLHASLICSLYKVLGVDIAAYFVQTLISSYETYYAGLKASDELASPEDDNPIGKECMNLIVLVSELYNFQVISCVLVYDIIRLLLSSDLKEFDVELLLKLIRNSGAQLRQDDPLALKDIVQIVQSKVSNKDPRSLSSRVRFMIETLTNLKNNKIKQTASQSGRETQERLKKFISGLKKNHHVLAHEPLRVSLEDLHSSHSKGKWWLVGAAWAGDPLVDRHEKDDLPKVDDAENALLKLARKQGMNTDVRRSIFVVLMGSEDYVDARERLTQLKLTEVQQREIMRVILHCCGNEKAYNPYYTLVGQSLSETSHAFKITLQYCLWDFLRDLGETNVGGAELIKNMQDSKSFEDNHISKSRMDNVAKAYAWWIAKGCSSLVILKPLDFTTLQPQTQEFLRVLFAHIFISSQSTSPALNILSSSSELATRNRETLESIALKAARNSNLSRGIIHFLSFSRIERIAKEDGMREFLKWGVGVTKETLRAGMDVVGSLG